MATNLQKEGAVMPWLLSMLLLTAVGEPDHGSPTVVQPIPSPWRPMGEVVWPRSLSISPTLSDGYRHVDPPVPSTVSRFQASAGGLQPVLPGRKGAPWAPPAMSFWPLQLVGNLLWSLGRVQTEAPSGTRGLVAAVPRVLMAAASGAGNAAWSRTVGKPVPRESRAFLVVLGVVLAVPALYFSVALLRQAHQVVETARQVVPVLGEDPRE